MKRNLVRYVSPTHFAISLTGGNHPAGGSLSHTNGWCRRLLVTAFKLEQCFTTLLRITISCTFILEQNCQEYCNISIVVGNGVGFIEISLKILEKRKLCWWLIDFFQCLEPGQYKLHVFWKPCLKVTNLSILLRPNCPNQCSLDKNNFPCH